MVGPLPEVRLLAWVAPRMPRVETVDCLLMPLVGLVEMPQRQAVLLAVPVDSGPVVVVVVPFPR